MNSLRGRVCLSASLIIAATVLPFSASTAVASTNEGDSPITILGGCGSSQNPDVHGGEAWWVVECTTTQIRINGWVKDTDNDGECARVTAYYPDGSTWVSPAACPQNDKDDFVSPYRNGRIIDAYLTVT